MLDIHAVVWVEILQEVSDHGQAVLGGMRPEQAGEATDGIDGIFRGSVEHAFYQRGSGHSRLHHRPVDEALPDAG